MFAVAVAVVAAPWIAASGSEVVAPSAPAILRLVVAVVTTVLSQAGLWAEGYLITGIRARCPPRPGTRPRNDRRPCASGADERGRVQRDFHGDSLQHCRCSGICLMYVSWSRTAPLILPCSPSGPWCFRWSRRSSRPSTAARPFSGGSAKSYRNPILYLRGAVVGPGPGVWHWPMPWRRRRCRSGSGSGSAVGVAAFAGVNFLRDLLEEIAGPGPACSRGGSTWSHALLGRLHRCRDRVLPRRHAGRRWSSTSSIATSAPAGRPSLMASDPLLEQVGLHQPGNGQRRREPAVLRGAGRCD